MDNYNNLLKSNTMLSSLSGKELSDVIVDVKKGNLIYRDVLGLPQSLSFGPEVEYEGLLWKEIDKYIKSNYRGYANKEDKTVPGGGEIASPTCTDKKIVWRKLKEICEFLTSMGAYAYDKAGVHINVGAQVLGNDYDAWVNFLLFLADYEGTLYRLGTGDRYGFREAIVKYAPLIGDKIFLNRKGLAGVMSKYELGSWMLKTGIYPKKWQAVSMQKVLFSSNLDVKVKDQRIEFRFLNGTLREDIIQNEINVIAHMLMTCKSGNLDREYLQWKLENRDIGYYCLANYRNLHVRDMVEVADMIFYNDLDKYMFMNQCVKKIRR